jgi:hypothetical protein
MALDAKACAVRRCRRSVDRLDACTERIALVLGPDSVLAIARHVGKPAAAWTGDHAATFYRTSFGTNRTRRGSRGWAARHPLYAADGPLSPTSWYVIRWSAFSVQADVASCYQQVYRARISNPTRVTARGTPFRIPRGLRSSSLGRGCLCRSVRKLELVPAWRDTRSCCRTGREPSGNYLRLLTTPARPVLTLAVLQGEICESSGDRGAVSGSERRSPWLFCSSAGFGRR